MPYITVTEAKNIIAVGGILGHYTHPDTQLFLDAELQADLNLVDALIRGGLESCGYGAATITSGSPAFLILADLAQRLFRAISYKRGDHATVPLSILDAERDARKELAKLDKLPGLNQIPNRKGMSYGSQPIKFGYEQTRGF